MEMECHRWPGVAPMLRSEAYTTALEDACAEERSCTMEASRLPSCVSATAPGATAHEAPPSSLVARQL